MNNVRLWIGVLTLVSFLAGAAGGQILSERSAARADLGPFAEYEARLVHEFELSPQRRRLLRVLLDHYHEEVARVLNDHLSTYRSAVEPELGRLGVEYNQYIRDKVLPPDQREAFDDLARGPLG